MTAQPNSYRRTFVAVYYTHLSPIL